MNLYEIKALTAHNKINDLANKTAVTLSHTFADNTARDTYFTANPTELVDNLFIKVGAGYQQYVGSAWEDATAVVADLSGIASELSKLSTEIKLKSATIEKELNDYQKTLSQVNVNQEAKQNATGYGVVSLPKNSANGQVSVSVKGITRTNMLGENGAFNSFGDWLLVSGAPFQSIDITRKLVGNSSLKIVTNGSTTSRRGIDLDISSTKKYIVIGSCYIESRQEPDNYLRIYYANKNESLSLGYVMFDSEKLNQWQTRVLKISNQEGVRIVIGTIRDTFIGVFNFDAFRMLEVSDADFNLSEEELIQKYPYIDGTKSTISAGRLKSTANQTQKSEVYISNVGDLRSVGATKDEIVRVNGIWKHIKRIDDDGITVLAAPKETLIEVIGTLLSYPSGTVLLEKVVADAGIYSDKFTILQQDLPIKEIEKISKVDFTTGVETQLDVTKAVINADKLSFTHPDLTNNDIVFSTYFFDKESTLGEVTVEYYDSRHVLKDSVTGKFYKIVPTVANGVLTNSLVEV